VNYFTQDLLISQINLILPGIIAGGLRVSYSFHKDIDNNNFKIRKLIADFVGSIFMSYAFCKFMTIKVNKEFLAFVFSLCTGIGKSNLHPKC
jgi:hypothetical protein